MDFKLEQRTKLLNRYRWIVWTPLAFSFLACYFHRIATGVMADSLMREFSITRASEISGLASVYFYIYAIMQAPAGILADTFGPRRTVTLALATATLGSIMFSIAQNIPMLYIGRILSSIGVSLIYINIVKIHAEWFRTREFSTMTGLIVVAGSSGYLLAATPLAIMVDGLGWRIAFLVIAAYTLIVAIACWFLVKDRPINIGLPIIFEVEAGEGLVKKPIEAESNYDVIDCLKTVLGNAASWWPFLASITIYGVYMTFIGLWGVPYFMQVYGMTRVAASNYIAAITIGMIVGGLLSGYCSDRFGKRRLPNLIASILFLALWLALTFWNNGKPPVWALYPLCFGIGIGTSGTNLNVACGKEVNPPSITGMVAGFVNSGGFIGAALLQPWFGLILDRNWQGMIENGIRIYPLSAYQNAFWWCAVVLGLGVFFTCLIKETGGVNICLAKQDGH